jgi:hypothetical protein
MVRQQFRLRAEIKAHPKPNLPMLLITSRWEFRAWDGEPGLRPNDQHGYHEFAAGNVLFV